MRRKSRLLKWLAIIVLVFVTLQTVSCGTILYPHRRGAKHSGDIDPKVAIMDGCGLLFFIIPGLVAYIVDFYTGAIYLGPGEKAWGKVTDPENWKAGPVYAAKLDKTTLEEILAQHLNRKVDLSEENLMIFTGSRTDTEALRSWLASTGLETAEVY
ncbi:MAG TPA: hypothetical protein ACFCUC_17155 [Desulfobacterales bacterium]